MKKKIIFFYNDIPQKQLLSYISNQINKSDYDIFFSKNFDLECDIGFYAHDADKIKNVRANLSFISLGGLDQGKLFWPNFWYKENWNKFDFGLLPGKKWLNMWQQSSWYCKARPKKAMLLTGWPKSEEVKIKSKFKKNRKNKTILYAPCFETDNKCKNVVDAIKKTKIKLLIKHLPWNEKHEKKKFHDVRKNINRMNSYAKKNLKKRVKIIDSKKNIMKFYKKADLLISDESTVIYEALLYDLPSLSCKDWPMRTNNVNKPRKINRDDSVCIYTAKKNLRKKILESFTNIKKLKNSTKQKKQNHFSFINSSAKNMSIFLDNYINKNKISFEVKPKYRANIIKSYFFELKKLFL